MEPQTIMIGQVTYKLRRTFQGARPLAELLAQKVPDDRSVDGEDSHAV